MEKLDLGDLQVWHDIWVNSGNDIPTPKHMQMFSFFIFVIVLMLVVHP